MAYSILLHVHIVSYSCLLMLFNSVTQLWSVDSHKIHIFYLQQLLLYVNLTQFKF